MFTRTTRAVQATTLLFISFTFAASSTAFSQKNFHQPIRVGQINSILDSMTSDHLQVTVRQQEDGMKFRVDILNPIARTATISIHRGSDELFSQSLRRGTYENIFDMNQLEDGNYVIIVIGGKEKVTRNITIHTETRTDRQATLSQGTGETPLIIRPFPFLGMPFPAFLFLFCHPGRKAIFIR
jgi:hypothetical protein